MKIAVLGTGSRKGHGRAVGFSRQIEEDFAFNKKRKRDRRGGLI